MANLEEYSYQLRESDDIYSNLQNELKEKSFAISKNYRIPIDIQKAVDINVEGQWKERLLIAKDEGSGKHITLIPCLVEHSYWIGVIIKFTSIAQVEFAEFLDPLIGSNYNITNLQKTFAQTYQGSILYAGKCEKHRDREQSMKLTIKNLLSAAERSGT